MIENKPGTESVKEVVIGFSVGAVTGIRVLKIPWVGSEFFVPELSWQHSVLRAYIIEANKTRLEFGLRGQLNFFLQNGFFLSLSDCIRCILKKYIV